MKCSSFAKVAFRNIILHRGFSLVSLIGLSIGIAISLLVLAYVDYETSYDSHFKDSENIYRLNSSGLVGEDSIQSALSSMPLVNLASTIPGVVAYTRIVPVSKKLVKSSYARFSEPNFYYADKGIFKVFELQFLLGDANQVFTDTNHVVISLSAAQRYFGTRNPLGEPLELDKGVTLKIVGVFADLPDNTHFKADFIANWAMVETRMQEKLKSDYEGWNENWFMLSCYSYIRIDPEVDRSNLMFSLNEKASQLMQIQRQKLAKGGEKEFDKMSITNFIQPITNIHLNNGLDHEIQKGASATYVGVFAGIAIFILAITAINFMNITTARSSRRFKEIAIRKSFGAGRRHLVVQFFIESILFSLLALVIALVFMEIFFEKFSILFDIPMGKGLFINHVHFGWVFLITLFVGVVAGSYPSFFFSGLRAEKIFKGQVRPGRWGIIVRGILVAFQICIAVALMSVSLSMHGQLKFLKNAPLGYDKDQLFAIEREYAIGEKSDSLKNALIGRESIEAVSSAQFLPGEETSILSYRNLADSSQVVLMATNMVDSLFFNTLGTELLKGRFFGRADINDSTLIVINESAANLLGYSDNSICRVELIGSKSGNNPFILTVVGVAKDIHYESFKTAVKPMVFLQSKANSPSEYLLIRTKVGEMAHGVRDAKELWQSVLPEEPFVHFKLSEKVDGFYRDEQRFARIGIVLAVIALLFAVLGLVGMVSFVVQSKIRNMLISRVLAATLPVILVSTFRGVSGYVFIGVVCSLLISPIVIQYWLSGFYYSFVPSGYCLVIPLAVMFVVTFTTIFFVGLKVFKSAKK
jgi:ABC-type antimicrobial peptide transport system permease subunit